MRLRRLLILASTGSLLSSLAPSPTTAQDDTPVDPDEVHAPVLVDFVDAPYPPEAAAARLEGIVVLKLSIDAEGAVTDVEVDAPAGHGFDEAAMEAARQFRFEPARRGASPVAARILYSYEFTLPPEGAVTGTVLVPDTTSDEVVVGALINLQGPDQQRYSVRTDSEGKFTIDSLPPGPYLLQAQAEGIGRVETDVIVADDQVTETTLRLLGDSDQNPIEVTVWGTTDVERLRRSAQAVQVVELDNAQREASDLGEVLARTEGVGVRRAGGIGSATTIQLNGLTGDQIRFFLDGVPLELSGYPSGAANVPINLLERVDVYRGVVPIQFGADALGGAINLVTEQDLTGTRGVLSYSGGSFDTQRVAVAVRHRHERTGFFTRANGFFDSTRNDYRILVDVPDDVGRLTEETVYRFHDAYQSGGGSLELGVVDVKWADRFIARGFATGVKNQLQHNIVMEVPYGEVRDQGFTAGGSLRYENAFSDRFATSLVAGYTFNQTEFLDAATCVYDWFGQCIRERPIAGEIQPFPRDQVIEDNTAFGRLNFAWRIKPEHTIRLTTAPTYVTRTGRDRLIPPEALDPLTARRDLTTTVTGLEYELNLVDNKLQNIAFVKNYLQFMRSEEPLPGGALRDVNRSTNRFGAGNGFRYLFTDWTYFKVSYEYATRLPRPEEVFGDGALIQDNLELQPEVSHNVNLQYTVDYRDTRSGAWRVDTNAFLREVDQLIVLLGNDQ
ncbi:MAG: TonB family protein, partial [Myxococcota bacterium]